MVAVIDEFDALYKDAEARNDMETTIRIAIASGYICGRAEQIAIHNGFAL